MTASKTWARALDYTRRAAGSTLPQLVPVLADRFGDSPALIGADDTISYRELDARINRYARWAMGEGLKAGDVVCLLMPNKPDYVALWFGLTRIGCTVALLNTNLPASALEHSMRVAGSEMLIVDPSLSTTAPHARDIWNWAEISADAADYAASPLENPLPSPDDRALLIYTSGTTGLPKAVNVTHRRIVEWSFWFAGMMDAQPSDRLYNCLPMYHSIGGVVAVGSMLAAGGSVVIRPRFSASRFWNDVCDYGCTIFQYIGELCRYLALSAPHPKEREHRLRLACGNGMHGGVWDAFQKRFFVPQILEFYAATEGNLSLYNCEGKPGAIGRVPPFLKKQFSVEIIRCDPETGEPLRSGDGFCVPCGDNEPGEAISLIHARRFDGYTDAEASERKILRNAFSRGDVWFRSGDLMRRDRSGFFFFIDRLGDTFRWKGENVSTTEVANVVRNCPGVEDAVVYGVPVAGADGRAGMVAMVTDTAFSFPVFEAHLQRSLPDYSRPMFVRLCQALDLTGTFKLSKAVFARQGAEGSPDPVWRRDRYGAFHKI